MAATVFTSQPVHKLPGELRVIQAVDQIRNAATLLRDSGVNFLAVHPPRILRPTVVETGFPQLGALSVHVTACTTR